MSIIGNITEWLLKNSRINRLEIGSAYLRWADGTLSQQKSALNNLRRTHSPGLTEFSTVISELKSLAKVKYGIEKYVALILSDQAFHFGAISVPAAVSKAGVLPLIQRDIQKNASLPFNAYAIKHENGKTRAGKLYIQYCALPAQLQESIEQTCNAAGLVPVSVQPSFACLLRLLQKHQQPSEHASVFLHIGNENTTMGIYESTGLNTVLLINFGVQNLIAELVKVTGCDTETAQNQLFKEPLLLEDPSASQAQHEIPAFLTLEPVFASFLQQAYGQLLLYTSENPEQSGFARITISGGGAVIKNIDRLIAYNLGISTTKISDELKHLQQMPGLPDGETLETLAPILGNLLLEPVQRDRFDRVMAA